MGLTNYPNGFPYGVTIRGVPILNTYTGKVFYVDSVHGNANNQGTFDKPLATINGAVAKCTANHGDIVVCKGGHAETVTSAGGITVSKAGIAIVAATNASGAKRPTITFSTGNDASFLISGDNVSVMGLVGVGNKNGLTNPFNVTGDDCCIDIEWQDASATVEAVRAILATTVSRLNVNIKYVGFITGDTAANAVRLVEVTGARINVDAYGEFSTGIVEMVTTASTDVEVTGYFYNDNVALSKNVVNTGGLACTWFAHGYDGKLGYTFSGGSAVALAADDISAVSSQATSIATGVHSVGTQVTAVASQATSIATGVVSIGTQTTGVASQATSVATGVVSVGAQVLSGATSIGTGTSVINSQAISVATGVVSVGTQGTAIASQATSIATGMVSVGTQATAVASQATSIATGVVSVGTQATAVASQATSIATGTVSVGAQVLSSATSVGTATSVLKSTCDAILSIVTSKP